MSERFTYLHTMLRVRDLDASVNFYTKFLGMQELRRTEVPEGKYTLVFVGYGGEEDTCEKLAAAGVKIPRPPGPVQFGTTVIAFIEDPDGYKIELIERK